MGTTQVETELKRVTELKNKLSQHKDLLGNEQAFLIQAKLQMVFKRIILMDIDFALDNKVDQGLWNYCFKNRITQLQNLLKDKKHQKRKANQLKLIHCLDSTIGFYIFLLEDVIEQFKLRLPFLKRFKTSIRKKVDKDKDKERDSEEEKIVCKKPINERSCFYFCHLILIHMGDLARYRNQPKEADLFYRFAVELSPRNGHPFNQLALHAASRGDRLTVVYNYVRSVSAKIRFPAAITNLERTFNATMEAYPNDPEKHCSTTKEFRATFIKVHALFFFRKDLPRAFKLMNILTTQIGRHMHVSLNKLGDKELIQMLVINLFSLGRTSLYLESLPTPKIAKAIKVDIQTDTSSTLVGDEPMPIQKKTEEAGTLISKTQVIKPNSKSAVPTNQMNKRIVSPIILNTSSSKLKLIKPSILKSTSSSQIIKNLKMKPSNAKDLYRTNSPNSIDSNLCLKMRVPSTDSAISSRKNSLSITNSTLSSRTNSPNSLDTNLSLKMKSLSIKDSTSGGGNPVASLKTISNPNYPISLRNPLKFLKPSSSSSNPLIILPGHSKPILKNDLIKTFRRQIISKKVSENSKMNKTSSEIPLLNNKNTPDNIPKKLIVKESSKKIPLIIKNDIENEIFKNPKERIIKYNNYLRHSEMKKLPTMRNMQSKDSSTKLIQSTEINKLQELKCLQNMKTKEHVQIIKPCTSEKHSLENTKEPSKPIKSDVSSADQIQLSSVETNIKKFVLELLSSQFAATLCRIDNKISPAKLATFPELATVKLILEWIREHPRVLYDPSLMKRPAIWPALSDLLNKLQIFIQNSKKNLDPFKSFPLPEERMLLGCVPFEKPFSKLSFDVCTHLIPKEMLNLIRANRILELGHWLAEFSDYKVILKRSVTPTPVNPIDTQFEPVISVEDILKDTSLVILKQLPSLLNNGARIQKEIKDYVDVQLKKLAAKQPAKNLASTQSLPVNLSTETKIKTEKRSSSIEMSTKSSIKSKTENHRPQIQPIGKGKSLRKNSLSSTKDSVEPIQKVQQNLKKNLKPPQGGKKRIKLEHHIWKIIENSKVPNGIPMLDFTKHPRLNMEEYERKIKERSLLPKYYLTTKPQNIKGPGNKSISNLLPKRVNVIYLKDATLRKEIPTTSNEVSCSSLSKDSTSRKESFPYIRDGVLNRKEYPFIGRKELGPNNKREFPSRKDFSPNARKELPQNMRKEFHSNARKEFQSNARKEFQPNLRKDYQLNARKEFETNVRKESQSIMRKEFPINTRKDLHPIGRQPPRPSNKTSSTVGAFLKPSQLTKYDIKKTITETKKLLDDQEERNKLLLKQTKQQKPQPIQQPLPIHQVQQTKQVQQQTKQQQALPIPHLQKPQPILQQHRPKLQKPQPIQQQQSKLQKPQPIQQQQPKLQKLQSIQQQQQHTKQQQLPPKQQQNQQPYSKNDKEEKKNPCKMPNSNNLHSTSANWWTQNPAEWSAGLTKEPPMAAYSLFNATSIGQEKSDKPSSSYTDLSSSGFIHQSLWAGPGPSPLERLLQQQRQQREAGT